MSAALTKKRRVAVLISGRGSNMQSLVTAAEAPDYPAEIVAVISNRPEAAGLVWARERGLNTAAVDHKAFSSRQDFDAALHDEILASGAELVACAGFMRLMTADLIDKWRNRMINIHPSLLPSFKGLDTHRRALEAGVRIAGCTVHVVRHEVDSGPILGQAAVPVEPDDTPETLAARVLAAEHRLYPKVLELFAAGQYAIEGDAARLLSREASEGFLVTRPRS